ncbi:MAG: hypothetical protein ABIH83_01085 [Candidatus Micrarchaeota archaeon]
MTSRQGNSLLQKCRAMICFKHLFGPHASPPPSCSGQFYVTYTYSCGGEDVDISEYDVQAGDPIWEFFIAKSYPQCQNLDVLQKIEVKDTNPPEDELIPPVQNPIIINWVNQNLPPDVAIDMISPEERAYTPGEDTEIDIYIEFRDSDDLAKRLMTNVQIMHDGEITGSVSCIPALGGLQCTEQGDLDKMIETLGGSFIHYVMRIDSSTYTQDILVKANVQDPQGLQDAADMIITSGDLPKKPEILGYTPDEPRNDEEIIVSARQDELNVGNPNRHIYTKCMIKMGICSLNKQSHLRWYFRLHRP